MPFGGPPPIVVEAGPPIKITAMNPAGAITGAEIVPIVQLGLNVQTTVAAVAALAPATPAILMEAGAATKISALPAAGALAGTEPLPIVQGGATVQTTAAAIAALAVPAAPNTSVQFNNAGVFGGSANLVFVSPLTTAHTLTVSTGDLTVTPGIITTGAATDMQFRTSGGTAVVIDHAASVVNHVLMQGGTAASPNTFVYSGGSNADVNTWFGSKGTGANAFFTGAAIQQFHVGAQAAQVSVGDVLSAAGGNGNAFLTAQGGVGTAGSTNININVSVKGTGVVNFWKTTPLTGQQIFRILSIAGTPANYIETAPANAGGAPTMTAAGSDADISLTFASKGLVSSRVNFQAASATFPLVRFDTHTSGNTQLKVRQVSNDMEIAVGVQGGLTNQNLILVPAGTGSVIFNPGSGATTGLDSATATTFNVAATPTTVNVGANATTVQLGKNAAGTLTIGPDTVVGSQATQNLWNTVATTINFGGAATAMTIGAVGVNNTVKFGSGIAPGNFTATQTARMFCGTGVPNNGNGADGDFYLQSDGTVAGNTVMYHKEGGGWVAFTTT